MCPLSARAADTAGAQRLFDEAKGLVERGDWQSACPKLQQSYQLDPRPTTLYRLAECWERTGKISSAHDAYLSAAGSATDPKKAEFARDRARRLEPSIPHLVISVSQAPMTIFKDGERLDETKWGVPLAVDPGQHSISASAPQKQGFLATVMIQSGATTVVTIPPLPDAVARGDEEPVPAPSAAASGGATTHPTKKPVEPPPQDNKKLRKWSIVLTGIGVVTLGVGLTLGLTSKDESGCHGTCAVGSGLMVGGAIFSATGIAFFLASFADPGHTPAPSASTSHANPFALTF